MNISLNWIKEYTKINLSTEELVKKIQSQIGEVEEVIDYSKKYEGIVVAEILSSKQHPDAEKLNVYKVNIGTEEVQVVAGDKDLEPGTKVAYFKPGTKVPYNAYPEKFDGIVTKTKLRGVESNGMLASEKELAMGNDHSQVLRLDSSLKAGTSIIEVFEFNDIVINIENKALANRADCFGLLGIAREISGIQGQPFKTPEWYLAADTIPQIEGSELPITIENQAGTLCPRYMAVTMSNVNIGESPMWLKSVLMRSGVRPISNIVDITNYLMILTGQPLHAFDYDKVMIKDKLAKDEAHITIRLANNNEKITTLDGKTHDLEDSMIMICDSKNPIAVGGVMGGLDTEIDENTKNIIIESANFDKYSIRRTSMKIGISSDAVTRYTKGQDPRQCESVLYKAVEMARELSGASVASEIFDSYLVPAEAKDIEVSISRLNSHLGTDLPKEEIIKLLDNIELFSRNVDDDTIIVDVPTYRGDLNIREDIHEEVGRLYGYDNITKTLPSRTIQPSKPNQGIELQKSIRKAMNAGGATEILTYNFVGADIFDRYQLDISSSYHIKNSLSPELEYMRTAMLPSVLEKVTPNLQSGYKEVALFEINKVHNKLELDDEALPLERQNIGFAFVADEKIATEKYSGNPYYVAKAYLENLLSLFGIRNANFELIVDADKYILPVWIQNIQAMYDPNSAAFVSVNIEGVTEYLGVLGNISPLTKKNAKLPNHTSGFEIDIKQLDLASSKASVYKEPSRFPHISFDLCFIVKNEITYQQILAVLEKALYEETLRVDIEPVDIYQTEEQKDAGLKQVTYGITVQKLDSTLNSEQVAEYIKRCSTAVISETGATVKE